MIIALIITNLIFNVLFGMTCGFICYQVLRKKKEQKSKVVSNPNYKR